MGVTTDASLQAIAQALAHLADPEIPVVSLTELGILREVREGADGTPEVVITPTYSGCPAMGQIEDDIVVALREAGLPGRVVTQLSPAWTTDWMSDVAREKLRAYGIAPPRCTQAAPSGVMRFSRQAVTAEAIACPQCGSHNTTETSPFGSTACKSLYKCLDCLEPFDYFKPI
ncbi:MAG: 1,2-phenylacetyl-CoA epoxidase subunit PaaD [Hydrogenophaga sp.]|uniref:1,2-phenylacetyl-CoA epoxidase subunit PaaD n=1 Tax=Hydrogenophaga sp. TaxID=1904254 RepID=UPI00274A697E|nr:1,2-phenylacetyl-CoA epoxidase subunit PaaD [Hydrogenophaga sp.]MDP2416767.1 1,2-phenylacetyl-CoA epoxidase subunit PaaD [Hydrogenophaga sp.]MDZ4186982.1 1,2-phenylacetyl-CoA epoxidase subunit PaaD [Hydrogenophaga sp.]